MPNVELNKFSQPAMWRKMALATWRHPTDAQVYARLEVDMGNALEYAREESERAGVQIAPIHLATRSVALSLKKYPDANAIVRWNRVYTRKRVHIFCHVAIPGQKPDLSGAVLRDADTKSPGEIAAELKTKASEIRKGVDREFSRTRRALGKTPSFLYRTVLKSIDFLQYTLNLDLSTLGLPQDPFGGAMVTSVGSLGVPEAFAPLVPLTRAPLVVSVGKVIDRPVVRDGDVVVRPICILGATFDHRIMDGLLGARLAKSVAKYLSDPEKYEEQVFKQ